MKYELHLYNKARQTHCLLACLSICLSASLRLALSQKETFRHNSADSVPASYVFCVKMASILNSQPHDLKHDGNHCEVIILSMKSLARMKEQVKSLVYKILVSEIDFLRMYDCMLECTMANRVFIF